jgi:hypothetical protein
MSFPEWGQSYNALHVPLASDWQCSLVPARDVTEPTSWWGLSYDEREQKRKDRNKQIEQDRRDFDRLFRVSIDRQNARTSDDFHTYVAFIREHLSISGMGTPVDGEDVTRILREAVHDGWLVPAIHRAWRGSSRVARPYAPQSWPRRAPDPKPTVYGVRNGQFVPLDANGFFIERTPYVPATATSGGGFDWLGSVEAVAGAVLGGKESGISDGDGMSEMADSLMDGDDSTPLGNAQAFQYGDDAASGDVTELAGRGVRMTGNEPGGYRINPNGQDVDYFDSDGNLCAQYHASHGEPHGHNFFDGKRDNAHLPMSPINCE